jgi:GAF domain-containing protein
MTSEREDMLLRRQKILADFGDFALQSEDLDEILTEACRLVGDAMGTGRAKVLEIEDDDDTLLVRAGVGWAPDIVGRTRMSMSKHSSESFAINERKPVISTDISRDERFEVPDFMKEAGVRALANVPISLPGGHAFGLLQVDACEPRDFDEDDVEFLRTYATILGPIVDRILKLSALRSSEERFRLTVAEASDYARKRRSDNPAQCCLRPKTARPASTHRRSRRRARGALRPMSAGICARTARASSSTARFEP